MKKLAPKSRLPQGPLAACRFVVATAATSTFSPDDIIHVARIGCVALTSNEELRAALSIANDRIATLARIVTRDAAERAGHLRPTDDIPF